MKNETAQKSFNMSVIEAKETIIRSMVNCKLPATVLQMILNEIKQRIDLETEQLLQKETEEYNKSIGVDKTKL